MGWWVGERLRQALAASHTQAAGEEMAAATKTCIPPLLGAPACHRHHRASMSMPPARLPQSMQPRMPPTAPPHLQAAGRVVRQHAHALLQPRLGDDTQPQLRTSCKAAAEKLRVCNARERIIDAVPANGGSIACTSGARLLSALLLAARAVLVGTAKRAQQSDASSVQAGRQAARRTQRAVPPLCTLTRRAPGCPAAASL